MDSHEKYSKKYYRLLSKIREKHDVYIFLDKATSKLKGQIIMRYMPNSGLYHIGINFFSNSEELNSIYFYDTDSYAENLLRHAFEYELRAEFEKQGFIYPEKLDFYNYWKKFFEANGISVIKII